MGELSNKVPAFWRTYKNLGTPSYFFQVKIVEPNISNFFELQGNL